MNFIQNIISPSVSEALGWTILHSLWQGAAIALVLYIAQVLTRNHTAQLRYNLALGSMLVMCVAVVITFIYSYQPSASAAISAVTGPNAAGDPVVFVIHNSSSTAAFDLTSAIGNALPWIVSAWLGGVLLLSVRFAGSMLYLHRLRSRSSHALHDMQERVTALRQQLKVSKPVMLVESALVKVPVTLGYLKPVIMLPAGIATGLSPAELEAVLAHELAHIRRNDFVINLLQSMAEIIFFYHPAVYWINSVVRKERENCCDDMAVTVSGALPLASALARLEELNASSPALALAATGQGALLQRIKRMVSPRSHNVLPKWPGAAVFMAALLVIGFTFYSNAKNEEKNDSLLVPAATDTLSVTMPRVIIEGDDDGDTLKGKKQNSNEVIIIKDKSGKTTGMYVNGEKIAAEKIAEEEKRASKSDIIELNEQESEKVMLEMKAHSEAMEQIGKEMEKAGKQLELLGNNLEKAKLPAPPPPPDLAAYEKAMAEYEAKMEIYEKEMEKYEEQMRPYEKEMEAYEEKMKPYEKEMEKYEAKMEEHEKAMRVYEERQEKFEKVLDAELIADKLVKSTKKYMFKLDAENLYIDGVKQSQELFEKYSKLLKTAMGEDVKEMKKDGSSYMIIKN